ncbi:unnamed protein product [Absidia cylindrospora]
MHNTATYIPCKKAQSNWVGPSSLMDMCGPEDISPPATPPSFNFTGPSSSSSSSSSSSTSSTHRTPTPQRPRHYDTRSSHSFAIHFPSQLETVFNDVKWNTFINSKHLFNKWIHNKNNSSTWNHQLLQHLIAPRLKIDFLKELPIEVSLHVLSFIDDPKTLARAACVSTFWNSLLRDEATWKSLCMKHQYQRRNSSICGGELLAPPTQRTNFSYRQYFKRKYNIAATWAHGGRDADNHRIEVFDTQTAKRVRTLEGHEGGVWALQFKGGDKYDPERTLVSGGCDRDVHVWDLDTGGLRHVLRGHTSTVRCLKMKDKQVAVSGSRDMTLRIWDVERGVLLHVLLGHQHSVRCLEIHGNTIVSGSYDSTARIWDMQTGRCLHVLSGHQSQIYAIVFDGQKVVTGSLDYTIKVWSADSGQCLATLQGHTSLVGQLQLSGSTLVSGSSDGCLRLWDLQHYECVQQISAHDNSVTCLQFDDRRMLSAGNDGKIKLFDTKSGRLIRNFSTPGKTVWKLQFNDTKAVVLKQHEQPERHTVMEVHDFDISDEDEDEDDNNSIEKYGKGNDNVIIKPRPSSASPLPIFTNSFSTKNSMMDMD